MRFTHVQASAEDAAILSKDPYQGEIVVRYFLPKNAIDGHPNVAIEIVNSTGYREKWRLLSVENVDGVLNWTTLSSDGHEIRAMCGGGDSMYMSDFATYCGSAQQHRVQCHGYRIVATHYLKGEDDDADRHSHLCLEIDVARLTADDVPCMGPLSVLTHDEPDAWYFMKGVPSIDALLRVPTVIGSDVDVPFMRCWEDVQESYSYDSDDEPLYAPFCRFENLQNQVRPDLRVPTVLAWLEKQSAKIFVESVADMVAPREPPTDPTAAMAIAVLDASHPNSLQQSRKSAVLARDVVCVVPYTRCPKLSVVLFLLWRQFTVTSRGKEGFSYVFPQMAREGDVAEDAAACFERVGGLRLKRSAFQPLVDAPCSPLLVANSTSAVCVELEKDVFDAVLRDRAPPTRWKAGGEGLVAASYDDVMADGRYGWDVRGMATQVMRHRG